MATLRELVTGRGYDASQGIIDEVSNYVPEINTLDSILIPGTTFQSVSLVSDPTTGFRTVGNGIDASDEGYALKDFALGILAGLCNDNFATGTGKQDHKDDVGRKEEPLHLIHRESDI